MKFLLNWNSLSVAVLLLGSGAVEGSRGGNVRKGTRRSTTHNNNNALQKKMNNKQKRERKMKSNKVGAAGAGAGKVRNKEKKGMACEGFTCTLYGSTMPVNRVNAGPIEFGVEKVKGGGKNKGGDKGKAEQPMFVFTDEFSASGSGSMYIPSLPLMTEEEVSGTKVGSLTFKDEAVSPQDVTGVNFKFLSDAAAGESEGFSLKVIAYPPLADGVEFDDDMARDSCIYEFLTTPVQTTTPVVAEPEPIVPPVVVVVEEPEPEPLDIPVVDVPIVDIVDVPVVDVPADPEPVNFDETGNWYDYDYGYGYSSTMSTGSSDILGTLMEGEVQKDESPDGVTGVFESFGFSFGGGRKNRALSASWSDVSVDLMSVNPTSSKTVLANKEDSFACPARMDGMPEGSELESIEFIALDSLASGYLDSLEIAFTNETFVFDMEPSVVQVKGKARERTSSGSNKQWSMVSPAGTQNIVYAQNLAHNMPSSLGNGSLKIIGDSTMTAEENQVFVMYEFDEDTTLESVSLDYLVRGGDGTTTTATDKITMSLYALRPEADNDPWDFWEELPGSEARWDTDEPEELIMADAYKSYFDCRFDYDLTASSIISASGWNTATITGSSIKAATSAAGEATNMNEVKEDDDDDYDVAEDDDYYYYDDNASSTSTATVTLTSDAPFVCPDTFGQMPQDTRMTIMIISVDGTDGSNVFLDNARIDYTQGYLNYDFESK